MKHMYIYTVNESSETRQKGYDKLSWILSFIQELTKNDAGLSMCQ